MKENSIFDDRLRFSKLRECWKGIRRWRARRPVSDLL